MTPKGVARGGALAALLSLQVGCDAEVAPAAPQAFDCTENLVGGRCAGVPPAPVCAEPTCTQGVACSAVLTASDRASLKEALAGASAGECIALSPGAYEAATLPAGVSLLGTSAGEVTLGALTIVGGSGAVVRGLSAEGIVVRGASELRIVAVRSVGRESAAVDLREGASVAIEASTLLGGASAYGLGAFGSGDVSIETTVVEGSGGPGVWVECPEPCACAAPPELTMRAVIVRESIGVGVALGGVLATLEDVDVRDNPVGHDFMPSPGLAIYACSDVRATGLRVLDNTSYGVLVHNSKASLGTSDPGKGLEVSRNTFGVWIQDLAPDGSQPVTLEGCTIFDNQAVGIGIAGGSAAVVVRDCEICGTRSLVVPVLEAGEGAGSKEVGDGIVWLDGSQVKLERLRLCGNERASVLIDGSVGDGSALEDIVQEGGDELFGIVQQNLASEGTRPEIGEGVPALEASPTSAYAVPLAPSQPVIEP